MKRVSERFAEKNYELIVVGAGMSGICAAMAAARHGMKTALIHARPVLGGNASSEIRIHISGADQSLRQPQYAETGILYELMLENKARNDDFNYSVWDSVLFEKVKSEKLIDLYLNTVMYDCETKGNSVTGILCVQETTEMRYMFRAPLFVDATGNGTLGYYAGAEYRQGSEPKSEFGEIHAPDKADNNRMGNTILMKARDTGHPVKFTPPSFAKKLTEEQLRYRIHCATHEVDTSMAPDPAEWKRLACTSCRGVDYGYWWLELMGTSEDIITEYETIRDDLVAYGYGIWDHIKNGGNHGAENYALEWVGALPGMRESRRLVGDYILTENDILEHRIFDDAAAYGGWCVDMHAPHGLLDFDILPSDCHHFSGVYTIPYRSYYSKNIDNLFMAGRDISTSRMALASTRIIGCCAVGGQAVGTAAALCKKYDCLPRDLTPHMNELRQILLKDDAFLPSFSNEDEHDIARSAKTEASSYVKGGEPSGVTDGTARALDGNSHAWISDGIAEGGEMLKMSFDGIRKVHEIRLTFDSDFSYPVRVTMAYNRQIQQRIGVPAELVKDYSVMLKIGDETIKTIEVNDNHQRLNVIETDAECDNIEFVFKSTNGADKIIVHEIRVY